jgi:hypothetical protein
VVVLIAVVKDIPPGMLQDAVKLDGGKGVGRQNFGRKDSKPIAGGPVHSKFYWLKPVTRSLHCLKYSDF